MRKIFRFTFFFFSISAVYAQIDNEFKILNTENEKFIILNKFIEMHNTGTDKAIIRFIEETYYPDLYKKLDLNKQVEFYQQIIVDFGPLNSKVYKNAEESPLKLKVHLFKKDEDLLAESIDPANILEVELDIDEKNKIYLSRGLGLGALICATKKNQ